MIREHWYGLHRLTESTGQLLIAVAEAADWPDSTDAEQANHLQEALAGVLGAIGYLVEVNHLDQEAIAAEAERIRLGCHETQERGVLSA